MNTPRVSFLSVVLCIVCLALPEPVSAGLFGAGRAPASYRTWTIKPAGGNKHTISQSYFPIATSFHVGPKVDLVVSAAAASASVSAPAGVLGGSVSGSLSGTSDLKAQLIYRLMSDRLLLQGGVSLPSGKGTLTAEEFAVAQTLSHPLLGIRLKTYGEGFNGSIGGALAIPLGGVSNLALGAGVLWRGSYDIVKGAPELTPARELSFSAGLDLLAGNRRRGTVQADLTYRVLGKDQRDSVEIFEEGNQFELQAFLESAPRRKLQVHLRSVAMLKQDSKVLSFAGIPFDPIPVRAGTGIFLRGGATVRMAPTWVLGLEGEWNRFMDSDTPGQDGTTLGIGPSVGFSPGTSAWLNLQAMALTGTLDPDVDLSGFDVIASFSWLPH